MTGFLIILSVFLLIYYLGFLFSVFKGLDKLDLNSNQNNKVPFLSVIIPFRDESENILISLKSIENQNYPAERFEVLFINDSSRDDSEEKLKSGIRKKNVKVLNSPNKNLNRAHKKTAVDFGINKSIGEIIVTTDADCIHGKNWLSSMVSKFDDITGFVSGPVSFNSGKSFFSRIQKLEFGGLVIVGAGLIGNGTPVICNAANLAFRRSLYHQVGGYKDNLNVSSGDDEFLMRKIAAQTDYSVKFSFSEKSMVQTASSESLNNFYNQRKRWASKGLFTGEFLLLGKLILIYLFYLFLIIQFFLGVLVNSIFMVSLLFSLLGKWILEYGVLLKGIKIVDIGDVKKLFFPAQILHVPYIVIMGLSGVMGNYIWKGREIER